MSVAAAPVRVHRALPPEEAARGDFYALLARLLHHGADAGLLESMAAAEAIPSGGDENLAAAWDALSRASAAMDADAAGEEYDRLFLGVGKSPISIFAGYYLGASAVDHPRVRLQADLAALGLERRGEGEPEDHFATLLDVMRVLVSGGAGRDAASVAEQKRFFDAYLKDGAPKFFNAVIACEGANYYRRVAALGLAFVAIESESFDLE